MSVLAAVDPAVDAAVALAAPARFDTPGVRTIEDLATGYDAPADRQIKTLVYVLDGALTLVLLRGDHALEEQKLIDATGARRGPAGRGRRDLRRARRAPGLARLGRRRRPADHRRPGPAGPVRHGNRRQHRQRAPARRRRRPRRQRRQLGGPAGGRGGGGVRQLRAAAHGHQGHRGRPHLQARLQVLRGPRHQRLRPRRQAGQADHGLLRHRRRARDGDLRRGPPRREGHRLAGQRRALRGRRRGRAAERREPSPRRASGPTRRCSRPGWT